MEAIASGVSDEQPGDGHIYWARTAEREHIPAAIPPITSAEAIGALHRGLDVYTLPGAELSCVEGR